VIVVDTSAIAAIYFREPEAAQFAEALWAADEAKISAGTVLELSIVLATRKVAAAAEAARWLDELLEDASIAVEPVDRLQVQIARTAYAQYGRGMGHQAQLNFGDCFAYALAKALDAPLLFKGMDFAKTDLRAVTGD
jgi:ribonuclease VapC